MHVGLTVSDVEASSKFYREAFGFEEVASMSRDEAWIGDITGYVGAHLIFIHLTLKGVMNLELVQYVEPTATRRFHDGTFIVGNVHLCLEVPSIAAATEKAVKAGAKLHSLKNPAIIKSGTNKGARAVYLRDPDGITIELFQRP